VSCGTGPPCYAPQRPDGAAETNELLTAAGNCAAARGTPLDHALAKVPVGDQAWRSGSPSAARRHWYTAWQLFSHLHAPEEAVVRRRLDAAGD
jgi:hypothetical protein